jgi:hypothetical protein
MEKIPMEWVEKLFVCMEQFYGKKWSTMLGKIPVESWKVIWQSGLTGLDYDTIKRTLVHYKQDSKKFPTSFPPHQMDFFHKAKNLRSMWNNA